MSVILMPIPQQKQNFTLRERQQKADRRLDMQPSPSPPLRSL
ncbi:hypothetical protein [Allocoleopsis franciscana]|nr:hypothetical protein [Allocoleopsis franciscana]